MRPAALLLLLALLGAACAPAPPPAASLPSAEPPPGTIAVDGETLLRDLRVLSAPEMEGRFPGTPGHARAQAYIRQRFAEVGLEPFGVDGYDLPFRFVPRGDSVEMDGTNLVGIVRGTEDPDRVIVVMAHYDHLGIRNGAIYHGADDNASGTAALFAVADHLRRNPPRHTVIIAALDAEELGLRGARAFVADPPVPLERIAFALNMDMISRSDVGELYAAGTYHYPFLVPLVERVAARAPITLLMGHDRPDLPPGDDWTMASDHGAFHERGIPFLYFGVEDHPGYHHPSDTFENITPEFYVLAVATILDALMEVDRELPALVEAHAAMRRGATVPQE